MTYENKALALKAVSVGALMAVSASTAFAGARVWDNSFSTCTTANCSSLTIPGTVTNPSSNNDPFEIQLFARANECVRIEVTSTIPGTADLETVVVAPNGSTYRDDDGGVGLHPLVKINGAPNNGWYTVRINHFNGTPIYADFVLRYGRYNLNNANCSGPTIPVFAAGTIKASEGVGEPQPGQGTFTGQ